MNKKLILVLAALATLTGCKSVTVRHTVPVQVVETHPVHHHPGPRPVQQPVIVQQHVHVETKVAERTPPPRYTPPHAAAPQPKPPALPVPRAQPRPAVAPEKSPAPVRLPHSKDAHSAPPFQDKPVPVMPQPRGNATAPREERQRLAERDDGESRKTPPRAETPPGPGRGAGR